jgi:hypothetical protein
MTQIGQWIGRVGIREYGLGQILRWLHAQIFWKLGLNLLLQNSPLNPMRNLTILTLIWQVLKRQKNSLSWDSNAQQTCANAVLSAAWSCSTNWASIERCIPLCFQSTSLFSLCRVRRCHVKGHLQHWKSSKQTKICSGTGLVEQLCSFLCSQRFHFWLWASNWRYCA